MPSKTKADSSNARGDSRTRLLDAAECLFADRGFTGVPVRDITQRAGTRLADVNELFGSKEELFKAVISRRAPLINADREARLAALPADGDAQSRVRAWVDAFAMPLLVRSEEDQGWCHYLRLIAQMHNSRSFVLLLVVEHFNPMAARFIAALQTIFPKMPPETALHIYQLMLSCTMNLFADNFRMNSLSKGKVESSHFRVHYPMMVEFVVAGVLEASRL
ncbi:MAG: TetR/AcrR family transcriptional regulator [Alcanivoracaceae bacterium]|nr:TetR/AcrR family transcriptional regulator [Alcanivoracaceae bacterium]